MYKPVRLDLTRESQREVNRRVVREEKIVFRVEERRGIRSEVESNTRSHGRGSDYRDEC